MAALALASLPLSPAAARAQAASSAKRITTASSVRVRSAPNTTAGVVATLPVGVLLDELGRSDAPAKVGATEDYWYRVSSPDGKQGWVFGGLTRAVDPNRLDEAYQKLVRDRLDMEDLSFTDWADLFDFTARIARTTGAGTARGEMELSTLLVLQRALAAIPIDKQQQAPYKQFLAAHAGEIVYSEPAGQWFVLSDSFWNLQKTYAKSPLGDRIAWAGAQNPIPGECEGWLPCHVSASLWTEGKYLTLYPNGEHAGEALDSLESFFSTVAEDLGKEEKTYNWPPASEKEEVAQLRKDLAELRAIVARATGAKRDAVLALMDKVAKG